MISLIYICAKTEKFSSCDMLLNYIITIIRKSEDPVTKATWEAWLQ